MRLPYAALISFMIGCVAPHCGHWKSANSSSVTAAVGEPYEFGGVAPAGALAGMPAGFVVLPGFGVDDPVFADGFVVLNQYQPPKSAATKTAPIISSGALLLGFSGVVAIS